MWSYFSSRRVAASGNGFSRCADVDVTFSEPPSNSQGGVAYDRTRRGRCPRRMSEFGHSSSRTLTHSLAVNRLGLMCASGATSRCFQLSANGGDHFYPPAALSEGTGARDWRFRLPRFAPQSSDAQFNSPPLTSSRALDASDSAGGYVGQGIPQLQLS